MRVCMKRTVLSGTFRSAIAVFKTTNYNYIHNQSVSSEIKLCKCNLIITHANDSRVRKAFSCVCDSLRSVCLSVRTIKQNG